MRLLSIRQSGDIPVESNPVCRMQKNLRNAILEMLILQILMDKSHTIGELVRALLAKMAEDMKLGLMLPALYALEKNDCIKSAVLPDAGENKDVYYITSFGIEQYGLLKTEYAHLAKTVQRRFA